MRINALNRHEEYFRRAWPKTKGPARRELLGYHRRQIAYLQHERMIHLIVTIFVFAVFLGSFALCLSGFTADLYLLLFFILLCLASGYLWHYYILENTCQRWQGLELDAEKKLLALKAKK